MLCRFFGLPGHDKGNAEELGHKAADAVLACDVRLCVVDDVHFLDVTGRDGREVANHFKYLANTFPITFLFVGVGLERRGLVRKGLSAGEEELAQNARRWTTLGVSPFEITTEAGRRTWRQLLLAIEKDLVLADAHPGMVADDLADYLFARSTGHFASLMTLTARGCRRAVRTGTEKLTRDLLDQVRNDAAAEAARRELLTAFDAGKLSAPPCCWGQSPGSKLRPFMAAIPVRLPPLPGEALDSWLEAYADLLHVSVRDIFAFAGVDWGRVNGDQRTGKPWLCQLDEPDLAALSAATRVPAATLAGMTLARYQGTGLAERPPRQACGGHRAGGASCQAPGTARAAWPSTAAGGCSPGGSRGPSPAPAARSCSPTSARTAACGTSAPAPGRTASPAAATSPACRCRHSASRAAAPSPAPLTPPARQPSRCPPAGAC